MHNPKRTITRTSSNLNEKIVNYYYKYGQNRNLEKYLRLKSSSEGSISTPESTTKNVFESPDENDNNSSGRKSNDKGKKKSYSFNCESNIAITIPCVERASMPNLSQRIEDGITEASQTDFESLKSDENVLAVQNEETNIETSPNADQQLSKLKTPDSILKSTSKRLEWDSLADVGYEKNSLTNTKSSSSLSTLERSVLKDFFADKGIEINFPNMKTKYDNNRLPKINEETNKKSTSQGAIPKLKTKEKWRETLENVQKKYRSLPTLIEPNATGMDVSQFKDISTNRHSTPKVIGLEKFCQTSLVRKDTQQIQCDFSNSESVRSAFEVGSMTSQSSFEYIPQVLQSETSCSNKENISPINSQNETIEQKLRKSVSKLFELQKNQSVDQKSYNEIDLGIQLLCSLIESKKMSDHQKKILAKKIVSKITKTTTQSCENISSNMTSTRTTTTMKSDSISSSFSIPSLIGKNITNKNCLSNRNKNNEQLVMSGVESIISNRTDEMSENKTELKSRRSLSVPKIEINKQQNLDEKIDFYSKKSVCKMEDKSNQVNVDSLVKIMKKLEIPTKINEKNPKEYESTSAAETTTTKSETTDDQETMREWLDPLTRSEIKYEDVQRRKSIKKINNIDGSGDFEPVKSKSLMKIIEEEKKAHYDWIEMEIKRLEQLKVFLLNEEKTNLTTLTNFIPNQKEANINTYPILYINNRKCEFEKSESYSTQTSANSNNKSSVKSKKTSTSSENYSNDIEEINIEFNHSIKKTADNVIYDDAAGTASVTKSRKSTKNIRNKKKSGSNQDRKINDNFRKHRSKLETPPPQNTERTESVRSFARQKKLDFIEGYKRAHSRDYDCPAETDHYSEPRNDNNKRLFVNNNKPFISGSSSNLFISSESISIPITPGAESSSMTTTHQYDRRCGIGIQTTDSILDTCPINDIQFPRKPTQRIYSTGRDQQIQVKPVTISYILKFDDKTYKNQNKKCSENHNVPIMYTESVESLTLEEQFKTARPKFYSNVLERQQILRNMQEVRQNREERIRDIVENTSLRSIPRKLEQLPPPATKHTRIFSTKEMKAMTKRKQIKLPEVLKKIEQQRNDRKKKGNQILKDVFNKRLQRRVHKGKLSLEHSQTVI